MSTHAMPLCEPQPVQSSQAPVDPQAVSAVPATQVVPEQQYPPPQVPSVGPVLHWLAQAPLTQVGVPAVQAVHTPLVPQVALARPALQVPLVAAEQQPPLQAWVELHASVHMLLVVSQASPAAVAVAASQSVVAVQPHAPATQTCPAAAFVQFAQTLPLAPQALFAVPALQVPLVAAEQQPPLHAWVELHAVVHLLVAASQA